MSDFLVPAAMVQTEQVIKKSRFITFIAHAPDSGSSHSFISRVRAEYPDAGHVCWAFIAGEPGNTTAISCSDDGEPAGTAGKPMLNVLQHSNVGEIVAVVVRYFGGIKLGTGGLVRAYSAGVTELMKELPTCLKVESVAMELVLPYALEDAVRRTLENTGVVISDVNYQETISMSCDCPADRLTTLSQQLNDAGRGQIKILAET
ncbi:MAG: YigZ family protein [Thiolinea sp.]